MAYSAFIFYIIILKIAFIFLSIAKIIEKHKKPTNVKLIEKLEFWRERVEFTFVICMALLLIYTFYPGSKNPLNQETRILFYLFGIILLITAKWGDFFKESPIIKEIQNILGG